MGSEDEDLDREIEAGARFAIRIRRAVQEPARWANILQAARQLMATVSETPIPPTMDDLTVLALAYVASIRCAKNLPGKDIEEIVDTLHEIAGA
jgi:hypothetical protein